MERSDPFAIRGESIAFDGSGTYLLGVRAADRFRGLEYRWDCEPPFDTYCDGMSEDEYYGSDGVALYGPDECARIADATDPYISLSDVVFEACGGTFC